MKVNIKDISISGLLDAVTSLGLKTFTARQLIGWLYQKNAATFDEMTNISKGSKVLLNEKYFISAPKLALHQTSTDGTIKCVWELTDGQRVESVIIPTQKGRVTLCISSQVGCAMGCTFCRTAQMGLVRNLTQSEIVDQVLGARRYFPDIEVTNIVFMGMGEPLNNLENVLAAIEVFYEPSAIAIAKKRVTVSTCGVVDKIDELADLDPRVKLAVSLNATTDEVRSALMPVNKRWQIRELLKSLRRLVKMARKYRVTIEYVMFGGINDSLDDAKKLVKLLSDVPCKINLISYNPFEDSPYKRPDDAAVETFAQYLRGKQFQVNIRQSRGQDIMAACGQLANVKRDA